MASFQTKISWKMPRKREIIVPITFYPAHNREFQKNRKKIQKIKSTIMASFQTKIGWKRQKIEKIKIIVQFRSYPTG